MGRKRKGRRGQGRDRSHPKEQRPFPEPCWRDWEIKDGVSTLVPSGLSRGSWRLPLTVPAPLAKDADISILRAGSDPFKAKQIEAE